MLRSTLIYNNFPMMFHWVKDLTRKGNFRWWAQEREFLMWLKPPNTLQFNREKLQKNVSCSFSTSPMLQCMWWGSHMSSRNSTILTTCWVGAVNHQPSVDMKNELGLGEGGGCKCVSFSYLPHYKMNCSHRVLWWIRIRNISTPSDRYW